jgi:predicted small metal-binding protein
MSVLRTRPSKAVCNDGVAPDYTVVRRSFERPATGESTMAHLFECIADGCEFMVRSADEREVVDLAEEHRQRHHPEMNVGEDVIRREMDTT